MKTVLIIDDEEEIVENLSYDIRDMPLKVLKANDGVEGFVTILQEKVDCIFTDIDMPHASGVKLILKLREMGIKTPVIVLSGKWDEQLMKDDMETYHAIFHVHQIIQKPYEVTEIKSLIKECLKIEA